MKINLLKFIPKKLEHRDILIQKDNNFIIVKCNKINPPRPLKLKSFIKINLFFMEIMGLYFGDGLNSRNPRSNRSVNFCNNCFELHQLWIKFLENFMLNKDQLRAQIQVGINNDLKNNELLDYWSLNTGIKKQNFQGISIKKNKAKRYGLLVVNFNNKLFRSIFNKIFDFCLDLCKEDRDFAKAFLKGLFAAEGHVQLNRNNSLATMSITIKDKKRRFFVQSLLENLDIKSRNCYERLDITGYLNFETIHSLKIANLHPEKGHTFKLGFKNLLNSSATKALTKIKILNLLKNENLTRFEISKKVDRGTSAIHKSLRDLENKGFVMRLNKSFSSNNKKLRDMWGLVKIPKDLSILMNRDY